MRNVLKILIVDDDKAHAQTLAELVKRMGFKPIVASKPMDALNIVRLQTVHAALVDVLLPKMQGVELVIEFRNTKFADNPVIFVSGVFKEKTFVTDALRRSGAMDFLFKPFSIADVEASLRKNLQSLLTIEKRSVQSLLMRNLKSDRERAKAIEHLEEVKGLDLPFVLSILMETGSSGHLNIVNDSGEIFGVTLAKGAIAEVDCAESQATAILNLISKGFLSQDDWDEFQKMGTKKFILDKLVEEGYVSPHAVISVRHDQIMTDLKTICAAAVLQVNFVPHEESEDPPKHAVSLHNFLAMLEGSLEEFFPQAYLAEFYASVKDSPIRLNQASQESAALWMTKALMDINTLRAGVERGATLEHVLAESPELQLKIYQGLHYLVLNRLVIFDDTSRTKNVQGMVERYKKLYYELQDKTPNRVFEYFGANINSPTKVMQNIFEEYARSNNPDQLGSEATPELQDLCRKCFAIVKHAYEILIDDAKRGELIEQLKVTATERQTRSQALMNQGLEMLRRGQAPEAFAVLTEAEGLFATSRITYIKTWAEIKGTKAHLSKQRLNDLLFALDKTPVEDKKSPFYFLALGLVKRSLGDATAPSFFEKALAIDAQFAEARRELNRSHNTSVTNPGNKKIDILNGDITAIVSQIFRRKAD